MSTADRPAPGSTPSRTPGGSVGDVVVPPPPRDSDRYPVLDTLRGVGALCVLTTHVAFWSGDYGRNGVWGAVLSRLDVGVALFFVLSGFLLSRPWLSAGADRRPAVVPYLWRRFLRIAPLYVVTAVVALGLIGDNRGLGPAQWLRSVLMLDTFTTTNLPAGLTQMWSLAVEVTFYLVLPLLMVLLLGRARSGSPRLGVARVLVGLALMTGIGVWWHLQGTGLVPPGAGLPGQWLFGYLGWFAAGILLALASVLRDQGRLPRFTAPFVALGRQPGCCWMLALGLMLVAATPLAGPTLLYAPTGAEATTKSLLYGLVGLLVVTTGVFPAAGTYATALSHPVGRRIGYLSFGVFCLHLPVLHLIMGVSSWELFLAPFTGLLGATVVVSLVGAELTYRLVERPALRLRDVGPGRRRGEDDPPQPTSSSAASGTTST